MKNLNVSNWLFVLIVGLIITILLAVFYPYINRKDKALVRKYIKTDKGPAPSITIRARYGWEVMFGAAILTCLASWLVFIFGGGFREVVETTGVVIALLILLGSAFLCAILAVWFSVFDIIISRLLAELIKRHYVKKNVGVWDDT